jgi:hypothetical protein
MFCLLYIKNKLPVFLWRGSKLPKVCVAGFGASVNNICEQKSSDLPFFTARDKSFHRIFSLIDPSFALT